MATCVPGDCGGNGSTEHLERGRSSPCEVASFSKGVAGNRECRASQPFGQTGEGVSDGVSGFPDRRPWRRLPAKEATGPNKTRKWRSCRRRVSGECCPALRLPGSFGRQAAHEVAGASLEDLAALVEKSLVRAFPGGRYELLEVIREFSEAKLAEDSGAAADVLGRHCHHYTDFLARIGMETVNLRAAWGSATSRGIQSALGSAADSRHWPVPCRSVPNPWPAR